MHVYLIRHGDAMSKAEAGVTGDAQRPLSEAGIERVRAVARRLRAVRADGRLVLLSSPLIRALQTAALLAQALGHEPQPEASPSLAPEADPEQFVARLQRCPASSVVFAVGHQPLLGRIASVLAFGGVIDSVNVRPAGVVWIELPDFPQSIAGILHGLWTPEILNSGTH